MQRSCADVNSSYKQRADVHLHSHEALSIDKDSAVLYRDFVTILYGDAVHH